ncbi:gliding motility-associated C-terminal domain-containing protein [Taibaiella koreensis]|uniref:gliding motility-associated C-terminal domain-containing protein n=1 Tax=Taibaiella koreensis TaxID=1268548 RepID=UPI000E59C6C6|nr:gliding motility-associated C-terminal domain-containing protein [Taibaiella koreensis]
MKRILTLLLPFLLLGIATARASHLLGGEIGYTYVSSSGTTHTYKVTLKFFADCSSTSAALPLLIGANPYVALYDNTSLINGVNLTYNAALSDVEITPVCPDEVNSTTCTNINNPIPGVKLYVYEGDFTVNGASANWRFEFEGSINLGSNAGRTPLITNADVQAGSSLMYLEATLNNTAGQNSTSAFTSVPTPFFCINHLQTYNLGAVDPDGDGLAFSLVAAKESLIVNAPPPSDIVYNPPYTATNPVPAAPGSFSFNPVSGQMNFNPNAAVNSVVVNKVVETRGGNIVGSSMREMAFIILTNCPNQGPGGPVTNLTNANADPSDPSTINACEGTSGNVSFDIHATDPEGDNIAITTTNLPAGALVNVSGDGSPSPTMHFSWDIGGVAPGDYVFYVNLKDDGCPISVTQTVAYTIRINPVYHFGRNDLVEICKGNTYLFYGLYYYETGLYDTTFKTVKGCDSIYYLNLQVNPLPDVVLNNGNGAHEVGICEGSSSILAVTKPGATTTYQWFRDDVAMAGETGPSYTATTAGTYWLSAVTDKGCTDTSLKLKVVIYPLPEARIMPPGDEVICAYDTMKLSAQTTGVDDYRWEPAKAFRITGGSEKPEVTGIFIEPTRVTLTVYNQYGCFDTDTVLVNTKPCCEVFTPNAFSPNGDGMNDYFKPALQTGQLLVSMQVFDRWGQLVYNNTNIPKGWDGNYENGSKAGTDTYMYLIRYTCADGKLYEKKESLSLIR